MHGFFASIAAESIGWLPSPFQAEVALANLADNFNPGNAGSIFGPIS